MRFEPLLGHYRSYGATVEEARGWLRGWLSCVAKTRNVRCCTEINPGGASCHELYQANLERARLEVASLERCK